MPNASLINRKDGELWKYKNVFSGWGKRYFRLERTYLHYFESKHSHEPIATITRGEITEVKPSTAFPGKSNVFEIVQKTGYVWYCQAKTVEEMVSWMQALSTVPLVLDAAQYPMVPANHNPSAPPANSTIPGESQPPAPHHIHSPYRNLIDQAHQTAYTCNTPHNCQHHNHHHSHHSPPPPYSAEGNEPPYNAPPEYRR